MRRPIRIGAHVGPQGGDYTDLRRAWIAAEELGADAIFLSDHFFAPTTRPRDPSLECWTSLAALAEATSRVALGPLVTAAPFRNPNLLADMARTVDCISGGRVILGLGAGWFRLDFVEYGYEFGTPATRAATLEATLTAVKARLPRLNPPPEGPLPILVAGSGERVTLRLVAEHADIWHLLTDDPDTLRAKSAALDAWCDRVGRPPEQIERACGSTPFIADPDALVAAGATLLTVALEGPRYDLGPLRETLAWRDSLARSG